MKSYLIALLLSAISLLTSQTTVFSDDFVQTLNEPWITSGQIGNSAFYVSCSGNDWAAKRNDANRLSLTNDTGNSITNQTGWVYAYTQTNNFATPYNTSLCDNPGLVTWHLNMRQSYTDPEGFGSTNWGVAFILAGQGTTRSELSGYALLLGQGGTSDPIRLARFTPGFAQTTNIIVSNTTGLTDIGIEYLSVKVTYDPTNNQWELFLRKDGTSGFSDPQVGELISQGTATDNQYSSISLSYLGAYWQGRTDANKYAYFDNVTVLVEDNTLPVELSYFGAELDYQNHVRLTWVSQTETGLVGYYVLRGETECLQDAILVSQLIGATNTSQQQSYIFTDSEINQSGTHYYWLQNLDYDGSSSFHGPVSINYHPWGNDFTPGIPAVTELQAIYPNPFNPVAYIPFSLAAKAEVKIEIFNSRGQLVRGFPLGSKEIGNYRIEWNGKDNNGNDCGTGIYHIRMQAGSQSYVRKAVLLK